MADIDAVVAGIEAGDYDDQLADIVTAIRERNSEAERELRWRITIDDETWDEDSVTAGEIRLVERTTGINWAALEPGMSADVTTMFIVAHWHKVGGLELKDAWDRAEALNAKKIAGCVSNYQAGPGKDQAASTT